MIKDVVLNIIKLIRYIALLHSSNHAPFIVKHNTYHAPIDIHT